MQGTDFLKMDDNHTSPGVIARARCIIRWASYLIRDMRYGRQHPGGHAAVRMIMVHATGSKQISQQQFIGGSATQSTRHSAPVQEEEINGINGGGGTGGGGIMG